MKLINDTDVLLDAFQLTKIVGTPLIQDWMQATGELTDLQTALLEDIYQKTFLKLGGWNEEELKMKLISFLFYIANIEEEGKINTFFERDMSADIGSNRLSVTCDCLIATPLGLSSPRFPYFFLQEFKRRKKYGGDPEGQMLSAMLIAQHNNNDGKPVYGAWLTGGLWEFAILTDKTYHASHAFNAGEKPDLINIIFILRKLKELIINR